MLASQRQGDECECSYLGDNHGNGIWSKGWHPVGNDWVVRADTFRVGAAGELPEVV